MPDDTAPALGPKWTAQFPVPLLPPGTRCCCCSSSRLCSASTRIDIVCRRRIGHGAVLGYLIVIVLEWGSSEGYSQTKRTAWIPSGTAGLLLQALVCGAKSSI